MNRSGSGGNLAAAPVAKAALDGYTLLTSLGARSGVGELRIGVIAMALDKPYLDIPGTTVFDADMSRLGFHLNQFCMSLMNADNREAFKADERGYLDRYPIDLVDDRATQSGASSVEGRL